MKLLLDEGLPRHAAALLRGESIDAVHVTEIGMTGAEDSKIMDAARGQERTVITLDSDFHTLLAQAGASSPSVVRFRIDGLRAQETCDWIRRVLPVCADDLALGSVVSVTDDGRVRIRRLPLTMGLAPAVNDKT